MNWYSYYEDTERRFIEYFLQKGNIWGGETQGPHAVEYLNRIQGIYGNLHVALLKAIPLIEQNRYLWPLWRDTIIRLFNFYDYRGLWREIYDLLTAGIRLSNQLGDVWAKAIFLFFQARIESQMGQRESALSKSSEALRFCGLIRDDGLTASLLHFMGMLLSRTDPTRAREHFEQSLAISKRINSMGGQAATLYEIGRIEERAGNILAAQGLYEQALAIFRELGYPREKATLLFQLGILRDDLLLLQEALNIYQALGDLRGYAQSLHQIGNTLKKQGKLSEAKQLYTEAIAIFKRLGAWNSVESVKRDMLSISPS
ncbi:MAG: tetratricopeptide repeat protein [Candidatus Bathyarchaeia archaeon]